MTPGRPGSTGENLVAARVPGYELGGLIGHGGMAHVYRAVRADGETVAIKLVRPDVARILGVERFLREIQIAASLTSPRLLPLEAWGEVDGLPWYAMPFAAGGSLRDRVTRDGQLPLAEAIRIVRQLAEGLVALHQAGIVHRDVKPENILLDADGGVRLADYGIARAVTAAAVEPLTSTGIVLGTPAYMSPEQAAGDPIDGRADIYALGCVWYELVAGEPPFRGATAQALMARHANDPPPPLRTVRPGLPAGVEALLQKTLAKAPADRVQAAADLLVAIDALDLDAPPAASQGGSARRTARQAVVAGVAVAVALVAWVILDARPALDRNRVVVFPFASLDSLQSGEGEQLALLIGSALERSEPIRWLDGWSVLDSAVRRDPRALDRNEARRLTQRAGARYYLNGSILRAGDSVRVMAQLNDLEDPGSPVSRTASGPLSTPLVRLALDAVVGLLPDLTGVPATGELAVLAGRDPAALIKWLQGERDYRTSRMAGALGFFEAAVAEDSLLAPAALRGAMAASWTGSERAGPLLELALRHRANLSPRQRLFATAFGAYLAGHATEAMVALRRVVANDSAWADAWMLAGDVQLHLLPSVGLDSLALHVVPPPPIWPREQLAGEAFARARQLDSTFLPATQHLAEIGLRQADAAGATRLLASLRRGGSDPAPVARLDLALRCARGGAGKIDWPAETRRDQRNVYLAGELSFASADQVVRACGRTAFTAVLAADTATAAEDWGALVGLTGILVSEGRSEEAVARLDSAVAGGLSPALGLFVLAEVAGVPVGDRGRAFIAQLGDDFAARRTPSLWLLTIWHAAKGHREPVERVAQVLAARSRASGDRLDRLMAGVAAGYASLMRGDSADATRRFLALEPSASRDEIAGSLWESLATERITLAHLLLARRQWALAHRAAASFDHPAVFVHSYFLRSSLAVRKAAADSMGDGALAAAASRRLAHLSDGGT